MKTRTLIEISKVAVASDPDHAEPTARLIPRRSQNPRAAARAVSTPGGEEAVALAATDPDGAERLARSIISESRKFRTLIEIAEVVAATDPDRAEHIVQSIPKQSMDRALAEIEIAKMVAPTDPDRAAWLLADAERFAQSITAQASTRGRFLFGGAYEPAEIAKIMAATDPDRAERIAQSIPSESHKFRTLIEIANVMAATDPDRAARIAQSITDKPLQVRTLVKIAKA